jgi:hypothetical protein
MSRDNYVKRQLDYLSGGKTNYQLLSSLRRADFYSRKVREDKQQQGAGLFDANGNQVKWFPDEYRKQPKENKDMTNDMIAGVTTLGIMKATGDGWELDEDYNKEIDFGGRLIKPIKGKIRALSTSVLKDNMETILEENNMVTKMVKLFLSDASGNICRYILPHTDYMALADAKATPEMITSISPNTPQFAQALQIIKEVTKNALPHIHFEESIDGLLSKFDTSAKTIGVGGGCCCK